MKTKEELEQLTKENHRRIDELAKALHRTFFDCNEVVLEKMIAEGHEFAAAKTKKLLSGLDRWDDPENAQVRLAFQLFTAGVLNEVTTVVGALATEREARRRARRNIDA